MLRPQETSSEPGEHVYTVRELTRGIKRLLESHWSALWVEGELSNVRYPTSGHVYFSLKDDDATLPAAMYRMKASRVRFRLEDGMKVRAFGQISVYEPRGAYQLIVATLEPVGTGDLELAFRQLRDRLDQEGLFAPERKKALPAFPRTVGLVTSDSGAALHDLLSVTARRAPHVRLVVRPARVQGEGAAQDVARAVRELDEWGGADVLIVGRGGGSLEDLWAFNEEVVARAIFECGTPVISAVGHAVDVTIADFVADRRADTPSVAAEIAVPDGRELRGQVQRLGDALARSVRAGLQRRRQAVEAAARSAALRQPLEFYRRRSQDVDRLEERLTAAARRLLDRGRLRLSAAGGRLDALSP
ncbi:MAG TPA: exodeoxyribonuclease VII large subunit, partial [bacterium]|nr:exodeoxyribonuclease VII large subunit [bacterium]